MKVRCIDNRGSALPEQYLDTRRNMRSDTEFSTVIGNEYVVYGVEFSNNQVWYYIYDQLNRRYPVRKPAPLFQIVDHRLSKYWSVGVSEGKHGSVGWLFFEEFFSDKFFYDRLTDGSGVEVEVFMKRKREMDEEFGEVMPGA